MNIRRLKPMKKFVSLLLALCLTLCCTAALAAGKLEVTKETYVATESYGMCIGYLYAEVTNTGDSNVEFSSGIVEILSESGDVTDTDTVYLTYPNILAPGEKGYIINSSYVDSDKVSDIADHALTVVGKTSKEEPTTRYDATATVESYEQWGNTCYRMVVTVTNNTSETLYDADVVAAVYDADGNLLYAGDYTMYNIGVPAGSSMEVRIDVDSNISAQWLANSVEPASVECCCYEEDF